MTESEKSILAFFISKQRPVVARFVLVSMEDDQATVESRWDRLLRALGLVRSATLKKYTEALAIQSMLLEHLNITQELMQKEDSTMEEFMALTVSTLKNVHDHESSYTASALWNVNWVLRMSQAKIEGTRGFVA
jgi:hypothetical protein